MKNPNELPNVDRIKCGSFASDHKIDGCNGAFFIARFGKKFKVIISDGEGWDHVSVSLEYQCPSWNEMCAIKKLFFKPEEEAIQFHPAESDYINRHPYCLHLWRNQNEKTLLPPKIMI